MPSFFLKYWIQEYNKNDIFSDSLEILMKLSKDEDLKLTLDLMALGLNFLMHKPEAEGFRLSGIVDLYSRGLFHSPGTISH